MAKKSLGFQFTVLIMLMTFFGWLAFSDKIFPHEPYISIILAYRPILLSMIGALAIPPLIALILQISSKDKEEFDDKPYYIVLKGIIHLIFSTIVILSLAVLFAYLFVFLQLISIKWLSFILSSVIILTLHYFLWYWLEKKFKLKCFGFFSYGRA